MTEILCLEDLEPSQVAFGGADPQRMLEPITWSKAAPRDMRFETLIFS